MENETLCIGLCPELGGKILSFYEKEHGFELAAQSGRVMRMPKEGEIPDFGDFAYGMDDAFPNINGEVFEWKGKNLHYPDHGEIWKKKLEVLSADRNSVQLYGIGAEFSYDYFKTMELEGDTLKISYRITNTGKEEFPCFWTWHGLIRYEEDAVLRFPKETTAFRNVLDSERLGSCNTVYKAEPFGQAFMDGQNDCVLSDPAAGERGSVIRLRTADDSGISYEFTALPARDSISWEKYYVEGRVTQGSCGMFYPAQGMCMLLEYDADRLPYLGFWVTAGRLNGDYNCALEPTNGFYDGVGIAGRNGCLPVLKPCEEWKLTLRISLKGYDRNAKKEW